jgi:hypothetical protein
MPTARDIYLSGCRFCHLVSCLNPGREIRRPMPKGYRHLAAPWVDNDRAKMLFWIDDPAVRGSSGLFVRTSWSRRVGILTPARDVWLLIRRDLMKVPRIRALADCGRPPMPRSSAS